MATQAAREALAVARKDAIGIASGVGVKHVTNVLEQASAELEKRLAAQLAKTQGKDTFTVAHMRAALEQIKELTAKLVVPGLRDAVTSAGMTAADASVSNTMQYLGDAHYAFEGMKAQPMALNEAFMFDKAKQGARASILRRLALSGDAEGVDADPHKAKGGILARYGLNVLDHFEQVMQQGVLMKAPIEKMRASLIEKSPFLQAAPKFWAERIVRTETMNAYNRSGWEAMREADDQLGDMCKILSATFDDRTAADSYAVHGQIRRMDEAFETWYGLMQHPPARPNDREVVVPHRVSWPIPEYLAPKTDAEVKARWTYEKRKGSPPARPKMTTIPYREFGKPQPLTAKEKGEETPEAEPQGPLEQERPLGYEMAADEAAKKNALRIPERATYSPEEKAAYNQKQALRALDAIAGKDDKLDHDWSHYNKYDETKGAPYLEGFSAEEKQIIKDAVFGDYQSVLSDMDIEVDTVVLDQEKLPKLLIKKSIEMGGVDKEIPLEAVKMNGKMYITLGSEDVIASSLLGKTHAPAKVLDLDNPGIKAFIKAEAEAKRKAAAEAKKKAEEEAAAKAKAEAEAKAEEEKKAKNKAKAAKAAATKAANKAKKLAAEQAEKVAAPIELPDVDVSAKKIDPANVLAKKVGEQKGSNKGGFYEGADGVKRYVKEYDDRAQAHGEGISNAIYRALGFDAPDSEVFEHNGKIHHAAKLFEGKTLKEAGLTEDHAKQALDGFAADVLLANWDVVGMSQDNLFVQPNGKLARIDNGGSLLMRAKAGRKDKTLLHQLTEWDNFFNHKNPAYAALAQKAGVNDADDLREQALKGIKQIVALREKHGGWDEFVSKVAPGFKGEDREAIVEMLEKRTAKLAEKIPELSKPKPKPEVQEAVKGKMAPPKTQLKMLAKAPAPRQTANETPDGRPLHEYRDYIRKEIEKAPAPSQEAIRRFSGASYRSMRDAYSSNDKTTDIGRSAHRIPEAFEHSKPIKGTVYRGMGVSPEIAQAYCDLDEDEPLHLGPWGGEPAFASASRSMSVAKNFAAGGQQPILFVIENKRGIGIETISSHAGENEVLMHPNAHFRVTKRYRSAMGSNDYLVLHMEELTEQEIEEHYKSKGKPVPAVKKL